MTAMGRQIKAMLDERPFRAFTISTSDGKVVTVQDPDFAWVHPFGRTMYVCPDSRSEADEIIHVLQVTKLAHGVRHSQNRKNKK